MYGSADESAWLFTLAQKGRKGENREWSGERGMVIG